MTDHSYVNRPPYRQPEEALAMAYVPWQQFQDIYENLNEAFCNGTIFKQLNKPFCQTKGGCV